jgi:hypothetical protein
MKQSQGVPLGSPNSAFPLSLAPFFLAGFALLQLVAPVPVTAAESNNEKNGLPAVQPRQNTYVVTPDDADNLRRNAHKMIDRITDGESPTPAEISAWLPGMASVGYSIDPDGTSLIIMPVLQLMDKHYGTYASSVSTLFRDHSVIRSLRSALLELIARHWDFPDSRNNLFAVFSRPNDDAILQGQIATILAQHEDIGDAVIARYSAALPAARFYYVQALAALGRRDAAAFLRGDARQTLSMPLRSAAVDALIELDPDAPDTADLINEVVRSARPVVTQERSPRDLDNELVAMRAIETLGKSANLNTGEKLLLIASDESVAIDVRLTALESLTVNAETMTVAAKQVVHGRAAALKQQITESVALSEGSRWRMLARISRLLSLTETL